MAIPGYDIDDLPEDELESADEAESDEEPAESSSDDSEE